MNLNRVEIGGGLTKTPALQAVGARHTSLIELSVALNGAKYDGETRQQVVKTTFVVVQCWGWIADQVARMNLQQGDEVYVLGELDQTEVEKDGKKERKTRVVASLIRQTRGRSHTATTAPPSAPHTAVPEAPQEPSGWGSPPPYGEPPSWGQ